MTFYKKDGDRYLVDKHRAFKIWNSICYALKHDITCFDEALFFDLLDEQEQNAIESGSELLDDIDLPDETPEEHFRYCKECSILGKNDEYDEVYFELCDEAEFIDKLCNNAENIMNELRTNHEDLLILLLIILNAEQIHPLEQSISKEHLHDIENDCSFLYKVLNLKAA